MLDSKVKNIEEIIGLTLSIRQKEDIKLELADLGLCVSMDTKVVEECATFVCKDNIKKEDK
jgi:hypothetical protein